MVVASLLIVHMVESTRIIRLFLASETRIEINAQF